jgi:uncharacterized membrane protein
VTDLTTTSPTLNETQGTIAPVPAARRVRMLRPLPSLTAILVAAALLPLRSYWAADVVLVLFAFTVPGVLALRLLRVPAGSLHRYPIYVPAAALFVLMASGLACDLLGPLIGISKPLHGEATAIAALIVCAGLWLVNVRAPAHMYGSWGALFSRPGLLVPLALPLASGAGALLLTNGHGDTVARAAAVATVLVLVFGLLRANKADGAQTAMILFACALAAEWAFSLRSQSVIGFDIDSEIYIAQHTQALGIWHFSHPGDAYGAMLSLTVLPSLLSALTGCAPLIAFKLLYPVLTALLPVSVFLVAQRIMSRRFAAVAASVLLVQNYFFQGLPGLARQEIAMVFFAALVATLLDRSLSRRAQLRIGVMLALGLVVSHYSSTYLAISVLVVAAVLQALVPWRRGLPRFPPATVCALVVLAAGAGLWYGALTHSGTELSQFVTSLEHQGLALLPNSKGGAVNSYLNGNEGAAVGAAAFTQASVRAYHLSAPYLHPLPAASDPRYAIHAAAVPYPPLRLPGANKALSLLFTLFSELILVLGVLGSLIMIFGRRHSLAVRQIGILALATVAFLAFIRFSGTAAAFYNQTRALLQCLLILSIPIGWVAEQIVDRLRGVRPAAAGLIAVGLGLIFAYEVGVTAIAVGGGTSLNLSARGEDYERQYMTPAELAGATWVESKSPRTIIQSDRYGQLRLFAATGRGVLTTVVPQTIDRGAWVYGTRTNIVLGRARGLVGSVSATYSWPFAFLNTNFDTVYDNGDSKVYHR